MKINKRRCAVGNHCSKCKYITFFFYNIIDVPRYITSYRPKKKKENASLYLHGLLRTTRLFYRNNRYFKITVMRIQSNDNNSTKASYLSSYLNILVALCLYNEYVVFLYGLAAHWLRSWKRLYHYVYQC